MHASATFIVFLKYNEVLNTAYSWLSYLNGPLSVTRREHYGGCAHKQRETGMSVGSSELRTITRLIVHGNVIILCTVDQSV